jgi:4-hydroxy-tetrahydrodipicolinate synthase
MLSFDLPERVKILEFAVKRSKLPVLAGVTHSTLEGTIELGQHAAEQGVEALLVMPPYYFFYEQEEIKTFYREFARRVGSKTPILLYNIPQFSNRVAPDTAIELIREGVAQGIKDSSGDWYGFQQMHRAKMESDFHLLVGDDNLLLDARKLPGTGTISGIGCALPDIFVDLQKALSAGDAAAMEAEFAKVKEFIGRFLAFPNAAAVKEAVALRTGIPVPPSTLLSPALEQKMEEFRNWFPGWIRQAGRDASVQV